MQHRPYTYLFWIQYLGLRYHGWQKQPGVKTVQQKLEKTIRYVLGHEDFTTLGASRTDTGVSCLKGAFELFLKEPLELENFIRIANENLPSDIRLLDGQKISSNFNIIQAVAAKKYSYYFAVGEKPHPFTAGSLVYAGQNLDIEMMKIGAALFRGRHDFRRFCSHNKNTADFTREIVQSEVSVMETFQSGMYPEQVYAFKLKGMGFLMHQVRRMMAALFHLGKGETSVEELEKALLSREKTPLFPKAPATGLVLEDVVFEPNAFR